MTNIVSALTARTQLGQIIQRASKNNERFVVDRRGESAVIIMSIKDYINTIAPAPEELKAMQARAKRTGANKLTMRKINSIIDAVREEETRKQRSR
jgi:PHD/YefM family antitoxin component YafN of YafNO toxin-antitoxin module